MIRKSDVKWWLLEARRHPKAAPQIIQDLVDRLLDLDGQNEALRNQIIRLQQRPAPAEGGSAQVQSLRRQVDVLKGMVKGKSSAENAIVFVSEQFQTARTSTARVQDVRRQGRSMFDRRTLIGLCALLAARPHEQLLMISNFGRGFKRLIAEVAPLIDEERWPESTPPALEPGERLSLARMVGDPPRFWTTVTQRGYVQRFVRVAFDRQIDRGAPVPVSPLHNDPPVAVVNGERGDVMLITRWGEAVRFPQRAIDVNGSTATRLHPDDRVVAAVALPQEMQVLILTTSGCAARYDTSRLAALAKPGAKSKRIFLARDVMALLPCPPQSRLLCLSFSGRLSLAPTDEIPMPARAGKGTQLKNISDPLLAVTLLPGDWLPR